RSQHQLAADEECDGDQVQPKDSVPQGHWRASWQTRRVNFARDIVDAAPPERLALVELARDGRRKEWTFGEVAHDSARLAGALTAAGVNCGDTVLTLIGNRPE